MTTATTVKEYSPGKARRLRRLQSTDGHFCIVALDQRAILAQMLADLKKIDASILPFADMLAVKRMLVEALSHRASAMLFDPNIAVPAAIDVLPRDTGLLVSIEHHRVEETKNGRKTSSIPDWNVDKIQRLGADGVKVLTWYHPDADAGVCEHQQNYVRSIGQQCAEQELPFVLELLAYQPPDPLKPGSSNSDQSNSDQSNADQSQLDQSKPDQSKKHSAIPPFNSTTELPRVVLGSVQEFVKPEYQVDLLKLESPVPIKALHNPDVSSGAVSPGASVQDAFNAIGSCCAAAQIPWVMLSAGVTTSQFITVLKHAYSAGAQGFLAGRAIWKEPLQDFPDLERCRINLNRHGSHSLDRLLQVTKQAAQPSFLQSESAPALNTEGDFASWYGNPN